MCMDCIIHLLFYSIKCPVISSSGNTSCFARGEREGWRGRGCSIINQIISLLLLDIVDISIVSILPSNPKSPSHNHHLKQTTNSLAIITLPLLLPPSPSLSLPLPPSLSLPPQPDSLFHASVTGLVPNLKAPPPNNSLYKKRLR